jgi:hypothetical protein
MAGGSTGTHIRNFKLDDAQEKTVNAAFEKAKATSGTSADSAALELICLDYVGGQTLQERLAVLDPQALAKTFGDVLNAISKDAARRRRSPICRGRAAFGPPLGCGTTSPGLEEIQTPSRFSSEILRAPPQLEGRDARANRSTPCIRGNENLRPETFGPMVAQTRA